MLNIMTEINREINAMPYLSEAEENWQPITADGGDCYSYATAKFVAAVASGVSPMQLRLATCTTETGGYHAVLLYDEDGQTYVLDNRYHYPMLVQDLNYTSWQVQVAGTQQWMAAVNPT